PRDPNRRPPPVAPSQPRLPRPIWFSALASPADSPCTLPSVSPPPPNPLAPLPLPAHTPLPAPPPHHTPPPRCLYQLSPLPPHHVAMIGDSVCLHIYISSPWSTFWRAHTCRGGNWFLDLDPAPVVRSVSKRLDEFTPLVATAYAGVGALVDDERERQNFFRS